MDAPFHIQSLLRAPTGHKAGLPGVRGPGAPLPSELQAWGRKVHWEHGVLAIGSLVLFLKASCKRIVSWEEK